MIIDENPQNPSDISNTNQESDYSHKDYKSNIEEDIPKIESSPDKAKQMMANIHYADPPLEEEAMRVDATEINLDDTYGFKKDDPFGSKESSHSNSAINANLEMIMDIPINIQIILGSCRMQISNLMNLSEGEIITLDKRIGEPVDITVNNHKIAKGEITIIDDDDTHFGIKLIEILNRN